MSELKQLLEVRGFNSRPAQQRLFKHLTSIEEDGAIREYGGVIAQAGTGTGKSMAILAAAAHHSRQTGEQSIIVTPTLTLMNQYRDGDTPWAAKAFDDLAFAEVRGMAHYRCEMSIEVQALIGVEHEGGCLGFDVGCTQKGWEGHTQACEDDCDFPHPHEYECGYRRARWEAKRGDVVVTNADMLIVNDRTLEPLGKHFLSLEGSLFVDEAHTLEQKLRDYASRKMHYTRLKGFKYAQGAANDIARWIERQERNLALKDTHGFPYEALREVAYTTVPEVHPGMDAADKAAIVKAQKVVEAAARVQAYVEEPHDAAVLHVNQGSLCIDWINVAKSAGELLTTRDYGLVSATVPQTMAASLGVPHAPFIDVGHPFDYGNQAWLGFSQYGGDYKNAQLEFNFDMRVNEVRDLLRRSKGGALLLFSSFVDLEKVHDALKPELQAAGLTVLRQHRDMEAAERQDMADRFKADGNAVLFGSESFATGFDVPGDALRLVVIWKLPYPAVDPVSNAIRSQSFPRYNDIMKVRAVQAIGRLIRTSTDRGIVWVADSRGRRLIDPTDPLTAHIPEFGRL